MAALIYEVLWVRLISLHCGNTTLAASSVLAAFMAGLAIGSYAGGKAADRTPTARLLLFYAILEAGIGLLGLASRPLIQLAHGALLPLGIVFAPQSTQSLVYFAASFAVLILPATCMGATLPVLTRWAGQHEDGAADRPLSLLYGLNTLGAVIGAVAAGFWWIPGLGIQRTLFLAAAANGLCAAAGYRLWRSAAAAPSTREPMHEVAPDSSLPAGAAPLLAALLISGAAAMICQVAWTRAFALVLGSTTYAFTLILTVFLLGLALGSELFHALRRRLRIDPFTAGALMTGIAWSILGALPVFNWLPYEVVRYLPQMHEGGWRLHAIQFVFCAGVMAFPTLLMGMSFPWIVAALSPTKESLGATTGVSYSANTVGAILGSALSGLLLIPAIGVENTLVLGGSLYAAAAVALVCADAARGRRRFAWAAVIVTVTAVSNWSRPRWDHHLVSSGMFIYGKRYKNPPKYAKFKSDLHKDKVVFHKDGPSSTVVVLEESTGEHYLRVNGKTDASSAFDLDTQDMAGYVPRLYHPGAPKDTLVVGFGSGATAGALASDPAIKTIDIVEIEPAVIGAAGFFRRTNRAVLDDPRVRVVYADGRQMLASSRGKYDIITSEPSNPWIAGVASLYTEESFRQASRALKDDGVFSQWFHSYYMSVDDFRMIMRTFTKVFPYALLISTQRTDFFLLGFKKPIRHDFARMKEAFLSNAAMRQDLATTRMEIADPWTLVVGTYLLGDEEIRAMVGDGPTNRDDRPLLEFSAPKSLGRGETSGIVDAVRKVKKTLIPHRLDGFGPISRAISIQLSLNGDFELSELDKPEAAMSSFIEALRIDPKSARAETGLGWIAEMQRDQAQAERRYRRAMAYDPNYARAATRLGVLYLEKGRAPEAIDLLRKALKLRPAEPRASLYLATTLLERGKPEEADAVIREALSRPILDFNTHTNLLMAASIAEKALAEKKR